MVSQQEYDPWGKVRTGGIGIGHTTLNYTGQRLDGTGLLYYHARYYDPNLARFISPDSIVPGASLGAGGALGTVGQEQNSLLTVDFHEGALLSGLQSKHGLTSVLGYRLSRICYKRLSGVGPLISAKFGWEEDERLCLSNQDI